MSLYADPTATMGTAGNLISSQSLALSASVTATFYVGVSGQTGAAGSTTTGSALAARLQVWNTGGSSVSTTNGVLVQVFSTSDGTNYDTIAFGINQVITTVASTVSRQSWDLPPGQYQVKLTNLDATNATTVEATLSTTA